MVERLDPLPPTQDEYWEHADTNVNEARPGVRCDHVFRHKTAIEVEWVKCLVGFILSPGWRLIGEHIYTDDEQFVI